MTRIRIKKMNPKAVKKFFLILACVLLACGIAVLSFVFIITPSKAYREGMSLMEAGDYTAAVTFFQKAGRYKDAMNQIDACYESLYGTEAYQALKKLTNGSTFQLGAYEQDNNSGNGAEPIEWIVLDKNASSILLVSRFGLDCQLYNTQFTGITWDTCSLREWLNNEFLHSAFSEAEIACINSSYVSPDKNPDYNTNPGKGTKDQIFLLSAYECSKYFSSDTERICVPTQYALEKELYMEKNSPGCMWWLRTPGDTQDYVSTVSGQGDVQTFGVNLCFDMCAVRPVLWLDLAKYYDQKAN